MKAIILMFDTLCSKYLPPYGNSWVHAPNFSRLESKSLTFDTSYVCSMPCIPARRELLSGRPNFLHRSWGPFEPFDDSLPKMLSDSGVYTHLATDHAHYFEEGGLTYHTQYDSWEFFRGQVGDPFIGQVKNPAIPGEMVGRGDFSNQKLVQERLKSVFLDKANDPSQMDRETREYWVNRNHMREEKQQPQARTIAGGLDFINRNADQDNWCLQIETFDPHEPFFTQPHYKDLYSEHFQNYRGRFFEWPNYEKRKEEPGEIEHLRYEYASLVSMCDHHLGRVLDAMDEHQLWDDTMLIVCTDHGFLLGEHDWWGKVKMPFYDEIARTPLFVWDPRFSHAGGRRSALVQPFLDIAPTLLNFFGIQPAADMLGFDLTPVIREDKPIRDAAIFGMHGGHVNVTDGRYVYMHAPTGPTNKPLYQYTLMPTHMHEFFAVEDFANMSLAEPFSFTKNCRTMKIENEFITVEDKTFDTMLFDLENDPEQKKSISDPTVEKRLRSQMVSLMNACDAPTEQYQRLGIHQSET